MKVLIVGAEGLLGTTVRQVAASHPAVSEVIAAGRMEIDIRNLDQVRRSIREIRPDAVLNTAALMPPEACDESPHQAYAINTLGARWVSECAAEVGAAVVYVTTDFVFDGEAGEPYGPEHHSRPLLTYGTTKLAGEHETRLGNDRHLIFRTAGLFGPRPRSTRARACFVDRVLDRALAGERLDVVDNIRMSPTYTVDLAQVMLTMPAGRPAGVGHVPRRQPGRGDLVRGVPGRPRASRPRRPSPPDERQPVRHGGPATLHPAALHGPCGRPAVAGGLAFGTE
jgi:dTDP-4-dehydrorhamnose reductase